MYGQFSKVKSVKIKKELYPRTKWGKVKKPFTDRIASENAFDFKTSTENLQEQRELNGQRMYIMFVWREQSKSARTTAMTDGMKQQ